MKHIKGRARKTVEADELTHSYQRPDAWQTREEMKAAGLAGLSEAQLGRSLRRLVAFGMVKAQRRGRVEMEYILNLRSQQ